MCWLINFLSDWQTLIGSAIGAILAIGGSYYIASKRVRDEKKKEASKNYSMMVAILFEIKYMTERYEQYLHYKFNKKDEKELPIISFNGIQPLNYGNKLNVFLIPEIEVEIYKHIRNIYTLSEVVRNNIEKAYVLKTIKTKEGKNTAYVQDRIVSQFYWVATSFMQTHLEDIYIKFNLIYNSIQKYAKSNNFNFPREIKKFDEKYVSDKIKKLNLTKQN